MAFERGLSTVGSLLDSKFDTKWYRKMTKSAARDLGLLLAENVREGERALFALPIQVVTAGSHLGIGAILILEKRVVLYWEEGNIRSSLKAITADLSSLTDVKHYHRRSTSRFSNDDDSVLSFTTPDEKVEIVLYVADNADRVAFALSGMLDGSVTLEFSSSDGGVGSRRTSGGVAPPQLTPGAAVAGELSPDVAEPARAHWCGQCGAALPGRARFCGQCGAPNVAAYSS
jgi:hypothetical protein